MEYFDVSIMARRSSQLRPKIAILLNSTWNLYNFRRGLVCELVNSGFEVIVIAPKDRFVELVEALGCNFVEIALNKKSINPVSNLYLLWKIYRKLHEISPDILLTYTIKPNIYGSIAAKFLHIPVINNITGLGSSFIASGWLSYLIRILYRIALSNSSKVFFQNSDDELQFKKMRIIKSSVAETLPGSGVDLRKFYYRPMTEKNYTCFLFLGRMLWDKGVGEFVNAAMLLKRSGLQAEYMLVGFVDPQNPSAIPQSKIDEWIKLGVVNYLGGQDDVRDLIERADCIVLPSYREGTSRALLEAAAIGRPIITCDVPGCAEVVDDGVNGYLCQPRDGVDLSAKMLKLAALSFVQKREMGLNGRNKIAQKYDEKFVISKYISAIKNLKVRD